MSDELRKAVQAYDAASAEIRRCVQVYGAATNDPDGVAAWDQALEATKKAERDIVMAALWAYSREGAK